MAGRETEKFLMLTSSSQHALLVLIRIPSLNSFNKSDQTSEVMICHNGGLSFHLDWKPFLTLINPVWNSRASKYVAAFAVSMATALPDPETGMFVFIQTPRAQRSNWSTIFRRSLKLWRPEASVLCESAAVDQRSLRAEFVRLSPQLSWSWKWVQSGTPPWILQHQSPARGGARHATPQGKGKTPARREAPARHPPWRRSVARPVLVLRGRLEMDENVSSAAESVRIVQVFLVEYFLLLNEEVFNLSISLSSERFGLLKKKISRISNIEKSNK